MRPTGKLLIALAILPFGHSAAAEPIYYDCDTPGGKYSEIKVGQADSAHRVRGTITPLALRPANGWLPTATVFVRSQDKEDFASVQLMGSSGKTLAVTVDVGENGRVRTAEIGRIGVKDGVSFDLYLPASGQAFAEVSGTRIPLGINPGPGATVSVTCSSGHFRFDPLDWDWQPLP